MNCEKYTQWLSAALDGELTAEQRRELDAHLAHCPDCAALFELLSNNARAMREMDCEFPEGLHDRIMNDLPPQEVPVKKNNVIHWRRWGSLAACLAVVAVLGTAVAAGGLDRMAPKAAAPEAAAEQKEAPASPGTSQDSHNESAVYEYSKTGEGQSDPMSAPSAVPSVLPETVVTPAPEATPAPDDSGFGNRIPVPSHVPGGLSPVIGEAMENSQVIRVGYGRTPPPSARVISSSASLADYLKGFGSNHYDGEGNNVPIGALEQLKETYTDEFFADRCLVAVVVESGSGSIRYEALSVTDGVVTVRATVPEFGTCDMAAWLIVIELDEMLDDGSILDVTLVN